METMVERSRRSLREMGYAKADSHYIVLHRIYVSFLMFVQFQGLTLSGRIAIVIAFTLPRVPGFAFASSSPLKNATDGTTPEFSRTPANFSFEANLDLQVDTGSNFLPLKFSRLSAQLFDLQTENLVAAGNITGRSFPAKKFTEFLLPLNFTYVALNDSDPTCE